MVFSVIDLTLLCLDLRLKLQYDHVENIFCSGYICLELSYSSCTLADYEYCFSDAREQPHPVHSCVYLLLLSLVYCIVVYGTNQDILKNTLGDFNTNLFLFFTGFG